MKSSKEPQPYYIDKNSFLLGIGFAIWSLGSAIMLEYLINDISLSSFFLGIIFTVWAEIGIFILGIIWGYFD